VAEDDEDEGALLCAARMSSGRDLVEEFIGYGVWPLAHGWVLGEVCPRQMSTLGQQLVRSPAFSLNLRGRDPTAFVREVEDGVVCAEDKGSAEMGYPRVQCSLESGFQIKPSAIQWLS
jgi:hypothetical protein